MSKVLKLCGPRNLGFVEAEDRKRKTREMDGRSLRWREPELDHCHRIAVSGNVGPVDNSSDVAVLRVAVSPDDLRWVMRPCVARSTWWVPSIAK